VASILHNIGLDTDGLFIIECIQMDAIVYVTLRVRIEDEQACKVLSFVGVVQNLLVIFAINYCDYFFYF